MAFRFSSVETQPTTVIGGSLAGIVATVLLIWIPVIALLGVRLVLGAFGFPVTLEPGINYATAEMLAAAVVVIGSCLLGPLIARWVRPMTTLPVAFSLGAVVLIVGAIGTRSIGALLIAVAFSLLAWLLGDSIAPHLAVPVHDPAVRLPLALALGLGILGLVFLAVAAFSQLTTTTVNVVMALLLAGAITINRHRLRSDIACLRTWRPQTLSWFETAILGLTIGLIAFTGLAAYVPETLWNASDATRQHAPIAREIWQTGSIGAFPPMSASDLPILGQLLYAVTFGLGGVTAAKLLQVIIGIMAILGVGGVGSLAAGRLAGLVSAALFASIPIALWNIGHLYPDLFAVLFTVTATLCVLLWQREGRWSWLVAAGMMAGFGLATKVAMSLMIVALAASVFLVGRTEWRPRDRLGALIAFAAGTLVVMPWLIRSVVLTGTLPGVATITGLIMRVLPNSGAVPASEIHNATTSMPQTGVAHTPLALLLSPWTLTFDGVAPHYRVIEAGEFGIGLLMLLPLALLGPRTRGMALLAVASAISYFGWVFSFQVPRHLLPTLALATPMAGIAFAHVLATARDREALSVVKPLVVTARSGIVVSLVAAPLLFLPNHTTRLPVDLLLGVKSTAAYLEEEVRSLKALRAATEMLPPDTKVGYIGLWEGPQFYTEARLVYLGTYSVDDANHLNKQLGTTAEEILASLDRLDIHYFIWNRKDTRPEDKQSTLLSREFLQDHTRIIGGDRDAYLYAVIPNIGRELGTEKYANKLEDPTFSMVLNEQGPWIANGKIELIDGSLLVRRKDSVVQRVPVSGGKAYMLSTTVTCETSNGHTSLIFRWFDANGKVISTESDMILPGRAIVDEFIWRRAPQDAISAEVGIQATGGSRCHYSQIELYELP